MGRRRRHFAGMGVTMHASLPESGATRHRIVIVGGGAGGLELASALGRGPGRRRQADIVLVDSHMSHLWKPLLHEVAAGTLLTHEDEVNYQVQAHHSGFIFRLGRMDRLDRGRRRIEIAPSIDAAGREYIPRRGIEYDTLILAVGGVTDDFGTDGVAEHCYFLDHYEQSHDFHRHLLSNCYLAQTEQGERPPGRLHIAVAGAGATGLELAAELHSSLRLLVDYGLDRIQPDRDIRITIIEAAERILPALPERCSRAVTAQMQNLGIQMLMGERVVRATPEGFATDSGRFVPAELKVWAAGIKAPEFVKELDGLETDRRNRLLVQRTLQTTRDPDIYALGDCAACPWPQHEEPVPPRAQAAHQQAQFLVKAMKRRLRGRPPPLYSYRDYGTLINMSRYSTIGNLMGNFARRWRASIFMEGVLARLFYLSLYKAHQVALLGMLPVVIRTLTDLLLRQLKPPVKLH